VSSRAGSSTWAEFPPHVLRDYAFIADGRRGALCSPRGDLVWLCAPRWDSPAVFSALIGGEGIFAVTPVEPFVWGGYYEPGTLIWRNRWTTPSTRLECRDALALPADPHRTVILRRIEAVERDTAVRLVLDLRAEFGAASMRSLHRAGNGVWTMLSGDLHARLTGAPGAVLDRGRLSVTVEVAAGGSHDVMLELSDRRLGGPLDIDELWRDTEQAWRDVVPRFDRTLAPRDAGQAFAMLHGLTTPGGGTVAAATLGLPERAERGRNYDYRYVWLRDQAYVGLAAAVGEPTTLFDTALNLVTARLLEHGADVAPAYRVDGGELPDESTLELTGYPGGADVVGNHAHRQFQLDTLGEALQLGAVGLAAGRADRSVREAIEVAVSGIERRWTQPDAGIWELDDEWWTHSRLACVAGLHRVAQQLPGAAGDRAGTLAEAILAETSRRCLHPSGRWQRSPGDARVDSALLLPPVRADVRADDRRTVRTLRAVESELVEDGYVYRYRATDGPLGKAEGAFVLCGFMLALATWHVGEQTSAMHYFERSRTACGPGGVFAEEYDVQQRQLRGNLPQAFTHAMLLEAAQRLAT
jgi:alpha,alpha-trehalase